jgi:ribose transport system substrate-binding protein
VLLAAVLTSSFTATVRAGEQKKLVIGVASREIVNDFNRTIIECVRRVVEAAGGEIIVTDGNADIRQHIDNISNLINRKVDGIVIELGDPAQLASVVARAGEAGIPVATAVIGQRIPGAITDVNGDEEMSGMLLGRQLLTDIEAKGKVFMISVPGAPVLEKKLRIFRSLLSGYDGVWMSDVYPTQHSVPYTLNVMQNILTANPNPGDITAVFVTYDLLASGAIQAIVNAGREKDNPLVATASQDTFQIGVMAAEALVDVINGGDAAKYPASLYTEGTALASKANIDKAIQIAKSKWGEKSLEEWGIDEAELREAFGK